MQLSKIGEQRLKQSLIETLHQQMRLLEFALENRDVGEIRSIGHSLRGNSGAAYFGLIQVAEAGRTLERIDELEGDTILSVIQELGRIAESLSKD